MKWILNKNERVQLMAHVSRKSLVYTIADLTVHRIENKYPNYYPKNILIDIFQWERRFGPVKNN